MGEFTIAASRLAPRALVVTLDPVPPTYWIMRLNLWLNDVRVLPESALAAPDGPGRGGVVPIHAAVGPSDESPGTTGRNRSSGGSHFVYFSLFRKSQAAFTAREAVPRSLFRRGFFGNWKQRRVPVRSVDGLVGPRSTVALLKMDCEGCEVTALRPHDHITWTPCARQHVAPHPYLHSSHSIDGPPQLTCSHVHVLPFALTQFEAIGGMPLSFFASAERVQHFAGEVHWGFVRVNNSRQHPTEPPPPTAEAVSRTVAALRARGCRLRDDFLGSQRNAKWHMKCPEW